MMVTYNTIVADVLGGFFKKLDKKRLKVTKKEQKMFWRTLKELYKVEETLVLHLYQ